MIKAYKGRVISDGEPVLVYRNLNGGKDKIWSIKQGGLVVAHATNLVVDNPGFEFSQATSNKVSATGKKTPHAYVVALPRNLKFPAATSRMALPPPVMSVGNFGFTCHRIWYRPGAGFVVSSDQKTDYAMKAWLTPDGRLHGVGCSIFDLDEQGRAALATQAHSEPTFN